MKSRADCPPAFRTRVNYIWPQPPKLIRRLLFLHRNHKVSISYAQPSWRPS